MTTRRFGATGQFPRGRMTPDDEGEIKIGIAHDAAGRVIVRFGKKVAWFGMYPEQAITFAKTILRHAGVSKITITFCDGRIMQEEK